MRTGLFNILQINPTPVDGNLLRLDINVEEAKPQEFGFSIGYGSYRWRDRRGVLCESRSLSAMAGRSRPRSSIRSAVTRGTSCSKILISSIPISPRSATLGADLRLRWLFEIRARRPGHSQPQDHATNTRSVSSTPPRHVEVTDASIDRTIARPHFIFRQLDRIYPDARPAQESARRAARVCFRQHGRSRDERDRERDRSVPRDRAGQLLSLVCAGPSRNWPARTCKNRRSKNGSSAACSPLGRAPASFIRSTPAETSPAYALPIDERFFSGGSTTVRSFAERDLGPHNAARQSDRRRVLHHLQCRIHFPDLSGNC